MPTPGAPVDPAHPPPGVYRTFDPRPPASAWRPRFLGFGTVAGGTRSFPRHRHQAYELIVPLAGPYRCRLNRVLLTLPDDGVLLVRPGDVHEDLLDRESAHLGLWLEVRLPSVAGPCLDIFVPGVLPEQQIARPAPAVQAAVRHLVAEQDAHDLAAAPLQETLAATAFWSTVRLLDPRMLDPAFKAAAADQAFPARLEAAFRRHAGHLPRLGDLAHDLGMAPRTLTTTCQRLLGRSPLAAHRAWRLDQAHHLLRETDLPVKTVASQCGYASPFHFARAYHLAYGHPPGATRHRLRPSGSVTDRPEPPAGA